MMASPLRFSLRNELSQDNFQSPSPSPNDGPLRFSLRTDRKRLSSRYPTFVSSESAVRVARTLGTIVARRTIDVSLSSASAKLDSCVRWRCDDTKTSPAALMTAGKRVAKRVRTGGASQSASASVKRTSAFVDTLLTFCPPAPDERLKVALNLSRGNSNDFAPSSIITNVDKHWAPRRRNNNGCAKRRIIKDSII